MNTFKFVGQIKTLKESKDKKYIETVKFDSGWTIERAKFRMVIGDSSEFIDISGGKFEDDSKNTVYTMFRKGTGSDREAEKAQVAWADRFKPDIVEKVPSYKRYTVDLSSDNIRKDLEEKGEHDKVSELAKKKYTFISQYDFAAKVIELLKSGAFEEGNFVVTGTVEYNYSIKDKDEGKYYRSFVPTNIYRAKDSDEQCATGKLDLYYLPDDVIGETLENGDIPVNGFLQFYERMSQENYYVPVAVYIKESLCNLQKVIEKDVDENKTDVKSLGINVEFFNGSPKEDIKLEDLDQDYRDLIDWGIKTFEQIKQELGSSVGESVNKIYMLNLARGWKAPVYSDVEVDKLYAKPDGNKKDKKKDKKKETAKFDLFDEDDEI